MDIVARYGGHEFVILLVNCNSQDASSICSRIAGDLQKMITFSALLEGLSETARQEAIEKFNKLRYEESFPIRFSAGIAEFREGLLAKDIISNADAALYKAKTSGKD